MKTKCWLDGDDFITGIDAVLCVESGECQHRHQRGTDEHAGVEVGESVKL